MKTKQNCHWAMKKLSIVGFNAILVAIISFSGCELVENSSQIPQTNEAKIKAAKNELAIPAETVSDIDLPTVLKGVAISWASSDEAVISSAGLVTRQPYDTAATLTATLALGNASDTREFEVTVPADVIEIVFEEVEAELVELSYWLFLSGPKTNRITMIYPDASVIFDCMVHEGSYRGTLGTYYLGQTIYWSDNPFNYIAFVEIVLKSEETIIGYALIEVYTRNWVEMHADILKSVLFPQVNGVYQNVSEEYVLNSIEKIKNVNRDAQKVARAKEELAVHGNSMNKLSWDSSLHCTKITWVSSDETVINSSTGIVTRPIQLNDMDVTLTAIIKRGSISDVKEFTVRVIAQPFEEVETELVELSNWRKTSVEPPNWIKMLHPNENVIFNYNEHFRLSGAANVVQTRNATVHSGDIFYWAGFEKGEDGQIITSVDTSLIDIVLTLEDNIIGYVVIRTARNDTSSHYAVIFQSVLFPQVNGIYQNVSEDYIKKAIAMTDYNGTKYYITN